MLMKRIKNPTTIQWADIPSSGQQTFIHLLELMIQNKFSNLHVELNIFTKISDFSWEEIWQNKRENASITRSPRWYENLA